MFILVMFDDGFYKNCLYNSFYENCLYNGFSYELLVCDGFYAYCCFLKIIFSIKKSYAYVSGKCKNVRVLWLCFFHVIVNVIIF